MDTNLPPDAPVPRLCHLYKWPDFDGFGFNLQIGHYIGKVDDDSPAQHADLREGDRIIEVNGVPISNENHKQVVQRIKAVPDETILLVIEQDCYNWYKDRDLIIRSTQSNVVKCTTPVPRPGNQKKINHAEEMHQTNGKPESTNESANVSLNTSTNLSTKDSTSSTTSEHKSEQDTPLVDAILGALESNGVDQVVSKLKSTKLQNESHSSIESNNNSEKAANQNLKSSVTPAKTHNFIVVNSEADFAAEKRKKDEQMRNNVLTNSTPIKGSDRKGEMNQLNLSPTSSISSSNTNLTTSNNNSLPGNMDLNLDMSAYEMRKLISSRRNVKAECKKTAMDLRTKYEIIQQM